MARGEFGPLSGSRQASKSGCDSSSRWGNRPPARTRAGIARSRLRYTASAGRASGHDLSLAVAGTGREICAELARGECDHGVRDLRPVNESGGAGSQPLPGEGCRKKCVAGDLRLPHAPGGRNFSTRDSAAQFQRGCRPCSARVWGELVAASRVGEDEFQ